MKDYVLDVIGKRFDQYGFPLEVRTDIIPEDNTTLFICSGMQVVKDRFKNPDGSKWGSVQPCIRTNDIDLVGDGTHLTSFTMVGNFHFGGDYAASCEMWDRIVRDLGIREKGIVTVRSHPESNHRDFWDSLNYFVSNDTDCIWSDGEIGGYCSEFDFKGRSPQGSQLEIGNLVNTLGHSVDVGFGLERLVQVVEGKMHVHENSLFPKMYPILADHSRTVELFWHNGIEPGNKKHYYVCRQLIRRMLRYITDEKFVFQDWIDSERHLRDKAIKAASKLWRKNKDKSPEWWWETCGVLPCDMEIVKGD